MKKIYTKPSLLTEKFAVESIMDDATKAQNLSAVNAVYLSGEIQGAINFSDLNTLTSINYADFE